MNDLIFIGGIHGAGKGTVCRKVCEQTDLVHITASEVLKWEEISKPDNKKVEDIQYTQNRLIEGLNRIKEDGKSYLLDGHFCLFNSDGVAEKVPFDTFKAILPKAIVVVMADVKQIKKRLTERDNMIYDSEILQKMQSIEKEYAKEIAVEFNVPFVEIKGGDYEPLIKVIS